MPLYWSKSPHKTAKGWHRVLCPKDCPADIGDILNVDAGGKCLCDLNDRTLAHTIGDQVCTGIHQNGPFDLI